MLPILLTQVAPNCDHFLLEKDGIVSGGTTFAS
jgi:hypothetical protein